jgi:capsular polysaccharide biosynthesis protein
VNDSDRPGAWPADGWPAGIDSELPERLWALDEFTLDEEPELTGGLVSLAFIREALRRKAWLWCTTAVLGLLIGSGLYLRYPPAYHAQTSVLLVDGTNQDPAVEVVTDQTLAQSQPVAAQVVQALGLQQSVASFQASYTVTPATTTVLKFDVSAPSSDAAVQRASTLASSFLKYRAKYAQSQQQELVAQLSQQYDTANQRLQAIDQQLSQLPSTQLTPDQKIQFDNLQTQLGNQKQIMQYATATEASSKTATDAMVSGSYVLNPATPTTHSHLKGAALYVAGGLFGGLVVGLGIAIVSALLSHGLRRRDDVAATLGAPVRLSVGSLRVPRWLPASRRRKAKRARDMKRVVAYLQAAVPGSSRGPASLAVVALDDVPTVALAVAALARACAGAGRQVVVADLSSGAPLARLLGVRSPGVHAVRDEGGRLLMAVPERDDVTPAGPLSSSGSPAVWAQPDAALVTACSSADVLLSLVTLDPALGADHLATWASAAVVAVTVGSSSVERVRSAGEMIRLAGTRLDSAILIGLDRSDQSLGVMDGAHPTLVGAAHGESERRDDGVPSDGFDLGE